jgi:CBS domain containing-hemolysin-like protein
MSKLFEMYERDNLLNPEERKLLTAALQLRDKMAQQVMTNLEEAYMLDISFYPTSLNFSNFLSFKHQLKTR